MTDAKKTRTMTIRRFIGAKLSGKTTAEGFLAAHDSFLRNYTFLNPILEAYENKELLPTPTLQAVQSALLTHMLESEAKTAEAKMAKQGSGTPKVKKAKGTKSESDGEEGHSKPYTVTLMCKVYDRKGENPTIQVGTYEVISGYKIRTSKGDVVVDTKEEAEGHTILETIRETKPCVWDADSFTSASKLADRRLFDRGDSEYAIIRNNFDKPIDTKVFRGDAIARILKQPKGPSSRTKGRSTKTLGFQPHAKQTRVTGPWSR